MLDFLYTLFIAPLEYWMHAALVWGYGKTDNWGEAVLVMSLVVNFVILPIYMKAEAWQEAERALRKSFEEKEKMIKRTFKGQERFAMISTMQRQAGYSPLLTLRSSIGFFLQVPFFFAAYHFLSHFEPLAGVSFLGLPDLSKPDGLVYLGGFSVNVMPFVMTAINVGSALVYTKNLTQKDKNQLYAMAALFLVLLYDAASGLVLYWTCNNVFSFVKNVCYDVAARCQLSEKIAAVVQWVKAKTAVHEAPAGGGCLLWLTASLWAAGVVTALASSNQATGLGEVLKAQLSSVSDTLFLAAAAAAVAEMLHQRLWRGHKLFLCLAAAVLWYAVNVWTKWAFHGSNRHQFSLVMGLGLGGIVLALANFRWQGTAMLSKVKSPALLYVPSAAWLVLLVTNYLPIEAFSTAPEVFSAPSVVLAKCLLWSAALGVVLWAVWRLSQLWHAEKAAGLALGWIATVFTVYAFLLPMDVGTIDAFQIAKTAPLASARNLFTDAVVLVAVTAGLLWVVRGGWTPQLGKILVVASVAAVAAGMASLWQCRGAWQSEKSEANGVAAPLPEWNDRLMGFAKDQPNVVIVMLDAFTGGHMKEIAAEASDVARRLEGFVWYSDAMAYGNSTISSVATILGGEAASPLALNAGERVLLSDKINAQYAQTIAALPPVTDVAVNERSWLEAPRLEKHLAAAGWQGKNPLAVRYFGESYYNRWVKETGASTGTDESDGFLLAVSLFKSVPWSGKNLVYRDGRWIEALATNQAETLLSRALHDWAFLSLLPEISNSRAEAPTLKFIDLEITHRPWFMDLGDCRPVKHPKRRVRTDGVEESHLASEICALKKLADWFDWMKAEGVYDNTTVVLVSDHSAGDSSQMTAGLGRLYETIGRPDALLLVKPAGPAQEKLREDKAAVRISNVAGWLRGRPFGEPATLRRYVQAKPVGTEYRVTQVFENRGPIVDPASWRETTDGVTK